MNPELVWYVSYGSNMTARRLQCYLRGGLPTGALRPCQGARDPRPPRADAAVFLPGGIYFAGESATWTGGVAYLDATLPGHVPARAYLITAGQFADVAAQEMNRAPQGDIDLAPVLRDGRASLGPGRYETLLRCGQRAGIPLLTFTAPHGAAEVTSSAPSVAYLRMLAAGLSQAHGWSLARAADYLTGCAGASGVWSADRLVAELRG
ncbi:MAG: histone deacetylase [Sciscionella sp.]